MHDLSDPPTKSPPADAALLREFVRHRSEPAFTAIVERHTDWIYSTALRLVHEPNRAADVTQAVFVLLARKAPKLSRDANLTGWLFLATRNISRHAVRSDARRRKHEQLAATMNPTATPAASSDAESLELIKKHMDEAMSRLGEADRDALLMRYYANESFPNIAATLGLSEDAARKRVNRALQKLHEIFARRGVALPAAGLGAVLHQLTQSAPSSVAGNSVRAALTSAPPHIAALTAAGSSSIGMTSVIAVVGTMAIIVPLGIFLMNQIPAKAPPGVALDRTLVQPKPKLEFTTTRPSAMKVGWLVSYSLAHSLGYGNGYQDHVTAIRKRFLDPQIELYALIEPGSETDAEQQQVIAANFPPEHTLLATDHASLLKLDVIVASRNFRLRSDVADAIDAAVREGTGLLIHVGLNQFDDQTSAQELMGLSNTFYFWTRNPVPCRVVSDHPLLSGLKASLPDGKLNIANLNGSLGTLEHGTPLIEAEDLSEDNIRIPDDVLHPSSQPAPKMYPMYISQLGKGLIVNCQWDSIPVPLVDLSNGRFYIHCCEYLAHRALD